MAGKGLNCRTAVLTLRDDGAGRPLTRARVASGAMSPYGADLVRSKSE